jgi:translation initiation factor 3 subunit M
MLTRDAEFIPAYNLLIHLVRSSPEFPTYLNTLLQNLNTLPATSPHNGPALVVSVLSTLFNVLPTNSPQRYPVYRATLKVLAANGLYDTLASQLKLVEKWVADWACSAEEARELYLEIANIAEEASDETEFYNFLVKALRTFPDAEAASPAARELATRLVKAAINLPTRLDFDEISTFPAIAALQASDPELFQLYEVFAGGQLEDYIEFNDEHDGWIEGNAINHEVAYRKIRLLTLTSLAASCPDRELPYINISRRLHVPSEEVEHWVIDVIRAGLVEGKLSQLNQTFLIHRAESRTFGKAEWEQVADRLDVWKHSLHGILEVVRNAKEQAKVHEVREQQKVEGAIEGVQRRGGRQQQQQQQQQIAVE